MRSTLPLTTTEERLRKFWGWNTATAISVTCHFAVLLAPTRRTLVTPIYPAGVGLFRNDLETVEVRSEVGATTPVGLIDALTWLVPICQQAEMLSFPLV